VDTVVCNECRVLCGSAKEHMVRYHDVYFHNCAWIGPGDEIAPVIHPEWIDYQWVQTYCRNKGLKDETQLPGVWMSRIPPGVRAELNPYAYTAALDTAGMQMRFYINSGTAQVTLAATRNERLAEVWYGDVYHDVYSIGRTPVRISLAPPENIDRLRRLSQQRMYGFDPALVRIVLPWQSLPRLIDIQGNITPWPGDNRACKRMLAYGSSITQGAFSALPSGTYSMRTAHALGVECINLGFAGGAYCEPAMAAYIASREDWDFAVLELGINMITELDVQEFERRVYGFVPVIAKAHPRKRVFCIDMFASKQDERYAARSREYRHVVQRCCNQCGCDNVIYINGHGVLPDCHGLTADQLHPSPYGMERMAHNLTSIIRTFGMFS
jgi:hypothetical protein